MTHATCVNLKEQTKGWEKGEEVERGSEEGRREFWRRGARSRGLRCFGEYEREEDVKHLSTPSPFPLGTSRHAQDTRFMAKSFCSFFFLYPSTVSFIIGICGVGLKVIFSGPQRCEDNTPWLKRALHAPADNFQPLRDKPVVDTPLIAATADVDLTPPVVLQARGKAGQPPRAAPVLRSTDDDGVDDPIPAARCTAGSASTMAISQVKGVQVKRDVFQDAPVLVFSSCAPSPSGFVRADLFPFQFFVRGGRRQQVENEREQTRYKQHEKGFGRWGMIPLDPTVFRGFSRRNLEIQASDWPEWHRFENVLL